VSEGDVPDARGTPVRVERYRVLQSLGTGGMGEVWEAEQLEPVRRRVALKIIKPGMDSAQVIARFEAERQALALMDHPGIARVFDAGVTEAGRPWFAMELVRGVPLHEYCDTQKLSADERVRLFIQVCNAIQHAHQKGVIHRDLKPTNILVTVQDGTPVPKVIDFGVAKAMLHDLTDRTIVTQLGHFIGTPKYVSPEQAEMSPAGVDTRTDIYSLGVILYELLVGAPPIDLVGVAWAAMSTVIREQEPRTPSSRLLTMPDATQESVARFRRTDPSALRRELAGDLDAVVMKCLEKDRTRRYDSVGTLAEDLERQLRHEPVSAKPPSATYRLRKFVRRHRVGTTVSALVLLLLMAFAATMSVQAARIARERDRTAREAAKAEAVRDFMSRILAAPDPVNALGPDASILEAVDNAVAQAGTGFSEEPEVDAAIRNDIGRVYLRLGRYDAAEPLLREALRIRLAVHGEGHAEVGETLMLLGDLADARSRPDTALALYSRSADLFLRLGGPAGLRLADVRVRQADLLTRMGRYEEAESGLLESLDRYRAESADNPDIAAVMTRLTRLYRNVGDVDRAEQYARGALEQRERLLPEDHALVGEALNNLAVVLDDAGEKRAAADYYRRALAIEERVFGPESEHVTAVLNNLALVHASLGESAQAEALYRRALAIDLAALGEDNIGVAIDRLNLGRHLCVTRDPVEGTGLVRAALRVFGTVFDPEQLEMALARSSLGVCLTAAGRYEQAERELLAALTMIETGLGTDHPQQATVRRRLADLYDAWDRPGKAAEYRR